MGSLSQKQIDLIAQDLRTQGITFDPLRTELLDHLICDIEIQMDDGKDFETALLHVKSQIPENHFNHIQTETMELLNKKINPTRILGGLSVALLALATCFKMLHLPGAGMLLLTFLFAASTTLLYGSARSVYIYRESKGRGIILALTGIIVVFILGLCFKLLHLPGAGVLLLTAVTLLCILFPALSIYFYLSQKKLKDHLVIRLISDNQTILEKTALTLIGFGLIFNYSDLLFDVQNFGGVIFFIFAMTLIGMHVYSLTWKSYVRSEVQRTSNTLLLVFSSIAFIMFMIPAASADIPRVLRHYFAYLPGAIFCGIIFIHYLNFSGSRQNVILAFLSALLAGYPLARLSAKLQWFDGLTGGILSNPGFIIGFLGFLLILLAVFWKHRLFKALVILTIASHMIPNL